MPDEYKDEIAKEEAEHGEFLHIPIKVSLPFCWLFILPGSCTFGLHGVEPSVCSPPDEQEQFADLQAMGQLQIIQSFRKFVLG